MPQENNYSRANTQQEAMSAQNLSGLESQFDRVPPHDDRAEEAFVGALLSGGADVVAEIVDLVNEQDFYQPKLQAIYKAIVQEYSAANPIDLVSVGMRLKDNKELDRIGGTDYLSSLVAGIATAANVMYYTDIIVNNAMLRNVIKTGTKITQLGYSASAYEADEVVNQSQALSMELGSVTRRQDYNLIGDTVREALQHLNEIQNNQIQPGVFTGFHEIDKVTQGLQPGQMIVVAGRPGMGKSTLGIDFARNAAFRQNMASIVFSLEMSHLELTQRILAAETNIPLTDLRRTRGLTPHNWDILNRVEARLRNAPLYIDDSPNMSLMEIRSKCRRLKQTSDLKLVVIDYLQLMSAGKSVESRQQEVSSISRALKLLAKELEVPVVALSQLNRGSEMRTDKKPQLADLRESGSIEQDADVVLLVHRPEQYDSNNVEVKGLAEIIMAKHRNGPTATFELAFVGDKSKFENFAREPEQYR